MFLVKTDYVGGVDITANQYYPAVKDPDTNTYKITDDRGYSISVITGLPSAHLNDTGIFKLYGITKIG